MQEAVEKIKGAGKKVIVVAPTAQASRGVLKDEGFKDATTVAGLLADKHLQQKLSDQVLWVDEAGLLGTADMKAILELASEKKARVVLSGDTRQHTAVARGDALRILSTVGGVRSAGVSKIVRQKDKAYREAVENLSQGRISDGFGKLDALGVLTSVDPLKPHEPLVNDYVAAVKKKQSALVICPTHKQGEEITAAIRDRLKELGKLDKREMTVAKLESLGLTEAQKTDWRNYQKGQIVRFNQNLPGVGRGTEWRVRDVDGGRVEVMSVLGETIGLPLSVAKKFDVYKKSSIGLSKGDKVRITRNGFDEGKKRLSNGQSLLVRSLTESGKVLLQSPDKKTSYWLDKSFGHLDYAHCVTSHAAQGKTVDQVFIYQPAATFGATDAKQFYVSVSRGRKGARVYTDDKAALLNNASKAGDRQSALELVAKDARHQNYVRHLQHAAPSLQKTEFEKHIRPITKTQIERDYEPGI